MSQMREFSILCEEAAAVLKRVAAYANAQVGDTTHDDFHFWFGEAVQVIEPLAKVLIPVTTMLANNEDLGWPK